VNWDAIFAVLGALHLLALAIVNITPTPADNILYGRVYKVIEVLAGVLGRRIKEFPGEAQLRRELALK
jgi:hypothetical protein